ncbi:retrovirus-related Pol polyprotein LINE-1 [Elysia marginata]|uniref:Retrovirus-related Pol polyprotein LINE-1 n=1 Tax=Elysia marginata TaxID=1093978 RepID=A0AAV4H0W1_9GAST|nr:retrovirus-related Pol polyprotein LINE-1 [Elysia marginata]
MFGRLLTHLNISERMAEHQKDLYMCFNDYTKAFDRVHHAKLMEVLTKAGVPDHERTLIAEFYWNQTAKVKTNSGTTEDINILRGVRQGCILSPALSNLYNKFLLQEALEEKRGISLNGENITNVFNYGCETWTFTKALKDKIMSFEMCCCRRVLRISWKKQKTNKQVPQAADVTERLLDQIIKRKLCYAGHVIRGSSGHLLQLALEARTEGRRGRGRPKRSWSDDIK